MGRNPTSFGGPRANPRAPTGPGRPPKPLGSRTVKRLGDISDLSKEWTPLALATVVRVMRNPYGADRDKLKAAEILLDRAYGKPKQAVAVELPISGMPLEQLISMVPDAIATLRAAANQAIEAREPIGIAGRYEAREPLALAAPTDAEWEPEPAAPDEEE